MLASFILGCGGGDEGSAAGRRAGLGAACDDSSECAEGSCASIAGQIEVCTRACDTQADCAPQMPEVAGVDLVCGVSSNGERMCVYECTSGRFACVDGTSTACEVADESQCDACGCPDDRRCEPGVGCQALSDVGGPCRVDGDCTSHNCSTYANVCRVPVAQPCTAANCDYCLTLGDWSYCSRQCRDDDVCNGGPCLRDSGLVCGIGVEDCYTCRPPCSGSDDPSCPTHCEPWGVEGAGGWFCDCDDCDLPVRRPLGAPCIEPLQCASDNCWLQTCTQTCASDADCGERNRCIDVPCRPGQITECGPMCLRECPWGCSSPCPQRERAEGGPASVCDPRGKLEAPCDTDRDCVSGSCVAELCTLGDGEPNGAACDGGSDCASGNCIAARCRGSAMIGDPCDADADCAVGSCAGGSCGV